MTSLTDFLSRHKRHVATLALVFGFIVDIITFRSLDLTLAQLILAAHLLIVAGSIFILSTLQEKEEAGFFGFIRSWLPVVLQYSTGNLLSAFLVLYSGSGSLAQSWPFFVLVAVAAAGNEGLKLDTYLLPFRTTLLYLNLLLFSALAVPILVHSIGIGSFLAGTAGATAVFALYAYLGRFLFKQSFGQSFGRIEKNAAATLAVFALLYFTNLIPPIPLSIKTIDFYHAVYKTGDAYVAVDEQRPFLERFFALAGITLHVPESADAYVYTAIFAPARLGTEIVHRWEYFDAAKGAWVTKNTTPFPIVGGRDGGYRGYSFTENPKAGRWRVVVETTRGQVVGRAYLTVERPQRIVFSSEHLLD